VKDRTGRYVPANALPAHAKHFCLSNYSRGLTTSHINRAITGKGNGRTAEESDRGPRTLRTLSTHKVVD